jgi:hypothetical protein
MNYYLTPAVEADASTFAENLREEDKAEIKAASGWLPVDGILYGVRHSKSVFSAWTPDHQPICIFGVSELENNPHVGVPWMLGTPLIQRYFVPFLRDGKSTLMPLITQGYDMLYNLADSRNTTHLRWLNWMGFKIDQDNPVYLNDPEVPFYMFTYQIKEQPNV